MASQTQYAWAAGFSDGEACVSLQRQKGYYCVRFHLVQKDIRPLEHFKAIFELDETIHVVHQNHHKRDYFRLTVSGKRAAEILTLMLPYLTLKREVAEVAIELSRTMESVSYAERLAGLTTDEKAKRELLYQRAKWLNSGRWAAAETKPRGPGRGRKPNPVSDSPNCSDDKSAESAEMPDRVQ
jgi:hypothetical protein